MTKSITHGLMKTTKAMSRFEDRSGDKRLMRKCLHDESVPQHLLELTSDHERSPPV